MFDPRKIPILRVVLPFFGGVLTGLNAFPEQAILPILILLFLLWGLVLLVFKMQRRKPGAPPLPLPVLLVLLIFTVGLGAGIDSRPQDPGLPEQQLVLVRGVLSESPRQRGMYQTFHLEGRILCAADSLYRLHTLLKCYLSMPSDSLLPAAGDTWMFCGRLSGTHSNRNPGMPDYREIMARNKCWYRFYIHDGPLAEGFNRQVEGEAWKLNPAAFREKLAADWHGDPEEIALLKAVCLGDRSSLSEDMRQAYGAAGGMHLLAVSGLHVGLIWWVLHYLTGWVNLIFRKEHQRTMLVLALLWFYAGVTGFSSSVCRAVTMFSFFSLGRLRGGQIHILNVILASAFLLVLIHPLRLMDIGFQLSYAAITGIVTIHPLLRSVLKLKSRLLRQIWEAGSISLAAQLATAPLIIFYFRQLPVYALVTSLVAIPMLSVLIAVFVCSLPLAALGVLEHVFSFLLVRLAGLMNRSMDFVSSLPGAVLGDLQLDLPELVVWMLILLMALMAMHSRNRYPAYLLLTLISTLQVWNALSCLERRSSAALVIAHFREASMLSYRVGTHVDHYCWKRDSSSLAYMEAFRELAWNRRIYKNRTCELASSGSVSGSISSCCMLREGLWLVGADGLNGLVLTAGLGDRIPGYACRSAYILLSGEPPLECIQELLDLEEMLIVMDGSNPKWYQERIVALRDGIYLTDQAGALVKRW